MLSSLAAAMHTMYQNVWLIMRTRNLAIPSGLNMLHAMDTATSQIHHYRLSLAVHAEQALIRSWIRANVHMVIMCHFLMRACVCKRPGSSLQKADTPLTHCFCQASTQPAQRVSKQAAPAQSQHAAACAGTAYRQKNEVCQYCLSHQFARYKNVEPAACCSPSQGIQST